MKDQESYQTLVARLPEVFIVESEDNSTDQLAAELTGLGIEDPPVSSIPGAEHSSQAEGLSVRSKKRLATTRGFDNSGLQVPWYRKLVTPLIPPANSYLRLGQLL